MHLVRGSAIWIVLRATARVHNGPEVLSVPSVPCIREMDSIARFRSRRLLLVPAEQSLTIVRFFNFPLGWSRYR